MCSKCKQIISVHAWTKVTLLTMAEKVGTSLADLYAVAYQVPPQSPMQLVKASIRRWNRPLTGRGRIAWIRFGNENMLCAQATIYCCNSSEGRMSISDTALRNC